MPRLTTKQYLKTHRRLHHLWLHAADVFSYLSPTEQWQLHAYFQPSKDLTDGQSLLHRGDITAFRPSLPHQAGRALAKLDERTASYALRKIRQPAGSAQHRGKDKPQLSTRSLVRPEPDLTGFVHAWVFQMKSDVHEQVQRGALVRDARPLQATVTLDLLPNVEPAIVDWQIPAARP